MTLTRKKLGHQSIGKELSQTTKKNTLFLATSIIESAHYTVTRSGRELDQENFKITYNRLKKLYEELG